MPLTGRDILFEPHFISLGEWFEYGFIYRFRIPAFIIVFTEILSKVHSKSLIQIDIRLLIIFESLRINQTDVKRSYLLRYRIFVRYCSS